MSKFHFWLRPLPNVALATGAAAFVALGLYVDEARIVPLAVAGAAVGVLSGVLDALSRRQIAQSLRAARTFAELIIAYQFSPWSRFKSLITVAALVGAWFLVAPAVQLPTMMKAMTLATGFVVTDASIRAVLGFRMQVLPSHQ